MKTAKFVTQLIDNIPRYRLAINTIQGYGYFHEGQDGYAAVIVLHGLIAKLEQYVADAEVEASDDAGTN